jgi:putative acetyltransferase
MRSVRPERTEDFSAIHAVNRLAFGRDEEARLVDLVRQREEPVISLVAVEDDRIIGHILFSPVSIASPGASRRAVGLGPMAVHPDFQKRGVGRELIEAGLEACRKAGYEIVVVLGHPSFYPRFGFTLARARRIHMDQEVPGDAFMVMELRPGALEGCEGTVRYLPEFMSV